MFKPFYPLFVALALVPALSQAGILYSGKTTTLEESQKTRGSFDLTLDGSMLTGRVFSSALGYDTRMRGAVSDDGRFYLRSSNPAVKGRVTGTLGAGVINGAGTIRTPRHGAAMLELTGKVEKKLVTGGDSLVGTYTLPSRNAEEWNGNLYSYVNVIVQDRGGENYHCEVYFAGKGGMRSDDVQFPLSKSKFPVSYRNNYTYRDYFTDRITLGKVEFLLTMNRKENGDLYIRVVVDAYFVGKRMSDTRSIFTYPQGSQ